MASHTMLVGLARSRLLTCVFPMDSPTKSETAGRLINYLLAHVTLALFGNFPLFCDLPVEGRENGHY